MRWTNLKGNLIKNVNISPYVIDWDGRVVSKPQQKVKDFLKPFFLADRVLEEFPIPGSRLRVDLINISKNLMIEVSPKQHFKFNEFFHKHRLNFADQIKRDDQKREWGEKNGLKVIELTDEDIKDLTRERFRGKWSVEL